MAGESMNALTAARRRWLGLLEQREALPMDDPMQNQLAPREHGAYAEFRVRDAPIYGAVEQLFAIPAYSGAKALGLLPARSEASVDEMAEGYRGLGRGVLGNVRNMLKRKRDSARTATIGVRG